MTRHRNIKNDIRRCDVLLKQLRNRNGHKELSRFQPILLAIKPGLWKACLERVCCLLPTSIPTNSITRPTGKEACHCLTLRGATFSLSSSRPSHFREIRGTVGRNVILTILQSSKASCISVSAHDVKTRLKKWEVEDDT